MKELLLLVGGDPDRRTAVKGALDDRGFSVVESDSPQSALGILREAMFDGVIVADDNRQLALRGLVNQLKRAEPAPRIFILLNPASSQEQLRAIAEAATLIQNEASADDVALVVHERFRKPSARVSAEMEDAPTVDAKPGALIGSLGLEPAPIEPLSSRRKSQPVDGASAAALTARDTAPPAAEATPAPAPPDRAATVPAVEPRDTIPPDPRTEAQIAFENAVTPAPVVSLSPLAAPVEAASAVEPPPLAPVADAPAAEPPPRAPAAAAPVVPTPRAPLEEAPTVPSEGPLSLGPTIEKRRVFSLEHGRHEGGPRLIVAELLEGAAIESERETFLRLGALATKLVHPNLPKGIEVGLHQGRPFAAWAHEPGATLHQLRRRLYDADRWPSPACATFIAAEIAAALEPIHDAKMAHGGLSPSWIWLTVDARVLLLGAGVANVCRTQEQNLQNSGEATPLPYLAPEQINDGITDLKSDLFVLGALLHELLLGDPLFLRDDAFHTNDAILSEPIPELDRALPAALLDTLAACLERDPDRRPRSASAVRTALLSALADPAIKNPVKRKTILGKLFGGRKSRPPPPNTAPADPRAELRGLMALPTH